MGRTVYCDEGDGNPAMVMVSNLETGEVVAICAQHWGAWIRTLADALPAGPAEMAPGEAEAAHTAAQGAEAVPATASPKRRRQGRETASGALDSEASPFPDATPVDG
jgi:hypothetical protein